MSEHLKAGTGRTDITPASCTPQGGWGAQTHERGASPDAEPVLQELGDRIWEIRHELDVNLWSAEDAIRDALRQAGGPFIFADTGDPPSGGVGLEPNSAKIVVVKSPTLFRAAYEPLAAGIFEIETPGVCSFNLKQMGFTRIPRPMFPFGAEEEIERSRQ